MGICHARSLRHTIRLCCRSGAGGYLQLIYEHSIVTERVTLITGASAGIGTELARVFASHGHRLALVARRADRLTALAAEITAAGGASPIIIPRDLLQPDSGDRITEALAPAGLEVEYVIHNRRFDLFRVPLPPDRSH